MALRLVQMHLETWDRTNLQEQENTFGRYKESGAPFGKKDEFDEVDLSKLPVDSHVRLAKEVNLPILRRSYSYSDGIDERTGQFDAGLIFIAYQKDPDRFVKIQTNLGAVDKMNEYITHIGIVIFLCFEISLNLSNQFLSFCLILVLNSCCCICDFDIEITIGFSSYWIGPE